MTSRVLVIGSGEREQALAWKLAQSSSVKQVLVAPGNAGASTSGKITNSAVLTSNPNILKQFCKDHNIGLVVISQISLLHAGIIDDLSAAGVRCFGPTAKAAQLESSKSFAKDFMDRQGIPTARWKSFTNPHEACSFITYVEFPALVVKPSGSKSGRDPYIAKDKDEACRAVQQLTQSLHIFTPLLSTSTWRGDKAVGDALPKTVADELRGCCGGFFVVAVGDALPKTVADELRGCCGGFFVVAVGDALPKTVADELRGCCGGFFVVAVGDALPKTVADDVEGYFHSSVEENPDHYSTANPERCEARRMELCRLVRSQCRDGQPEVGNVQKTTIPCAKIILPLLETDLYDVVQAAVDGRLCRCLPLWAQDKATVPIQRTGCLQEKGKKESIHYHSNCGHIELNTAQYKDPVLICTTNSAAAEIKVAQAISLHSVVAHNLVAECVNDLLSQGAETLFFMPHLACGKLDDKVVGAISNGLAVACKMAGSALLKRNIAQMPCVYPEGRYSLSGCAVGVTERENRIPRLEEMMEGDLVIGVRSPGVHCSELLLNPSTIYSNTLLPAIRSGHVRACTPVTEGGLLGSIGRVLPESLGIIVDALCWKIPDFFSWLYIEGDLSAQEMVCNFNCGIGAVIIAPRNAAAPMVRYLQKHQETWLIGALIQHHAGSAQIQINHLLDALKVNSFQLLKNIKVDQTPTSIRKVAVFISTPGTKLKLLIDITKHPGSCARLSLVISNKAAVEECRRAAGAGIPTRVIDHTSCRCHSEFESTICKVLEEFSIDLICLEGFTRTLSDTFLSKWKGKIVMLYPSLSPSIKGEHASQRKYISGCTVCFMLEGAAPGPIIVQETVTANREDTEVSLSEQMEDAKEKAVTKAILLVASGALRLGEEGSA
ncbi:trifunctional purine biosynthetic protein adenosine-3-like [Rhinophrynus dorsalis]